MFSSIVRFASCKGAKTIKVPCLYRCISLSQPLRSSNSRRAVLSAKKLDELMKPIPGEEVLTDSASKSFEQQYPEPRMILHNIMAVVDKELKSSKKNMLFTFRPVGVKNTSWSSTCHLEWPSSISFSATAKTKTEAAKVSSLKALQWLSIQGKVKNNKPILMDKTEFANIKSANVEIRLNDEDLARVDSLFKAYNQGVKTSIQGFVEECSQTPMEVDDIEEVPNSISESFRLRSMNNRNKILQKRAEQRFNNELCHDTSKELPIYNFRQNILDSIVDNRVVVLKGEPGCGKSTQVPQYLLDDAAVKGQACDINIIVTQPRRISAITLAERVASERNEEVGDAIGYHVRFKSVRPRYPRGCVNFYSSGILLRMLQSNPKLEGVSHVILDEAHERDVNTDLLMLLLKRVMLVNSQLKLVIMSATINPELFQNYYPGAHALSIPGFTYPVQSHYLDDITGVNLRQTRSNQEPDLPRLYHDEVANLIGWITNSKPNGAILCFLPGWQDIKLVAKHLENKLDPNKNCVLPLHSRLAIEEQTKIFGRTPTGVRKIILSTNIAETSVTIDDVVYVVDTGVHKEERLGADKGTAVLDNDWVSQANVNQRRGRAGRVAPGESYHMYSSKKYRNLPLFPLPELLRVPLQKVVLDLKTYNEKEKAVDFLSEMAEPPSCEAIQHAVGELIELGALTQDEALTPLGRRISKFTTHPKLSKALVHATIFRCLDPMLTICSILAADADIFFNSLEERPAIVEIKKDLSPSSDHLAALGLFNEWRNLMDARNFHEEEMFLVKNMLKKNTLRLVTRLRKLSLEQLKESKMITEEQNNANNVGEQDLPVSQDFIKSVLFSGISSILFRRKWDFKNGVIQPNKPTLITETGTRATLASDCVCHKQNQLPSPFFVYFRRQESTLRRCSIIRDASVVSPLSVALFSNETPQVNSFGRRKSVPYRIVTSERGNNALNCMRTMVNDVVRYYLLCADRPFLEKDDNISSFRDELVILLSDLTKQYEFSSHQPDRQPLPAG